MSRRMVVLVAGLAATLYLILRPVARLLLFPLGVPPVVYAVVVWTLALAALLAAAALVGRWNGLEGVRLAWGSVLGVAASIALLRAAGSLVQLVPTRFWPALFSEPATAAILVAWSALTVLLTWLFARAISGRAHTEPAHQADTR